VEEKPAIVTGKRLFILAALLLLAAAVGLFVSKGDSVSYVAEEEAELAALIYTATESAEDAADSDGDGLFDWEEVLWKTDKNNPDSDGDGTFDGEEVAAGRNPTRTGPNDELQRELDEVLAELAEQSDYGEQDLTATDLFAQDFLTEYIRQKQTGAPLSESAQAALVDRLAGQVPSIQTPRYSTRDFTNIADGSSRPEDFQSYSNELAAIMSVYGQPGVEHELLILMSALKGGGEQELAKLDHTIASYQAVIDHYLTVRVPQEAVEHHLGLINALAATQASISALRNVLVDPILALSAVNTYLSSVEELVGELGDTSHLLTSQGVEFDGSELGSLFNSL